MLQVVGRERRTINYPAQELRNVGYVRKSRESQGPRPRMGDCAAMKIGYKVIVEVTIHNGMTNLRENGAGGGNLRHDLWERFGKTCHQGSINESKLRGMVKFKFKRCYNTKRTT